MDFKIEGWFPPCIANTLNGKYACCGSLWIKIPEEMTMDEVMKGYICIAPICNTHIKPKINKKPTKKQLAKLLK